MAVHAPASKSARSGRLLTACSSSHSPSLHVARGATPTGFTVLRIFKIGFSYFDGGSRRGGGGGDKTRNRESSYRRMSTRAACGGSDASLVAAFPLPGSACVKHWRRARQLLSVLSRWQRACYRAGSGRGRRLIRRRRGAERRKPLRRRPMRRDFSYGGSPCNCADGICSP